MRTTFFFGLALAATGLFASGCFGTEESADELIAAALRCELQGDSPRCQQLLSRVKQSTPNNEAARWLAGEVVSDGYWSPSRRAEYIADADPIRADYQAERNRRGTELEDEIALARWCAQRGMKTEELMHWRNVLRFDSQHALARRQTGVRLFQGEWLTEHDYQQAKEETRRQLLDYRDWLVKLRPMVADAVSANRQRRDSALEQIRLLEQPGACAAMAQLYESIANKNSVRVADLGLAMVTSLTNMRQPQATTALVQFALWPDNEVTRAAAVDALRYRRLTDFVPYLMNSMAKVTWIDGNLAAQPTNRRVFQFSIENALAVRMGEVIYWNNVGPEKPEVARIARNAELVNERVQNILANVTGEQLGTNPSSWWEYWRDYNDLQQYQKQITATYRTQPLPSCECFPAGTLVPTITGPRPIERLRVGDQVLSQDIDSGHLAYRSVLATTLRNSRPTLTIIAGDQRLTVTNGHRFWVTGFGWRMAKNLEPGQRLRTDVQSLSIDSLEEATDQSVYNLVVEDFHTFFVGDQRFLVHDNSCPKPTVSLVPGWAAFCGAAAE